MICISFPLLCNRYPQPQQLKTTRTYQFPGVRSLGSGERLRVFAQGLTRLKSRHYPEVQSYLRLRDPQPSALVIGRMQLAKFVAPKSLAHCWQPEATHKSLARDNIGPCLSQHCSSLLQSQQENRTPGISLEVQWLRLRTPNAGGPGSNPGQGTRSRILQLQIPHATTRTWHSQINK